MKDKVALIILDGWGIGQDSPYNAVANANTPNLNALITKYPHTKLVCSGNAVGLPSGQMGNSEVGHLNIGAGRIVYQDLTRISKAIDDGDFFANQELLAAIENAKQKGKALHLMGLVSDGGVHSHNTHLYALMRLAKNHGLQKVYIHAFLDGRDVAPKSAQGFLQELNEQIAQIDIGSISTISGRYYAMDRDKRYERIKLAYDALVNGQGEVFDSADAAITASYNNGIMDEFVKPCIIGSPDTGRIDVGDSVIFFNFRPDRARQITRALVDVDFTAFERSKDLQLYFVCMTQYDKTIKAPIAYKPQDLTNTLGAVLAAAGKIQLRIAETEKYAHVTFFFNGGVEEPNQGEKRLLIDSPKVATYDLKPQMSAYEVTEALINELAQTSYDSIILNFANADMVGHTGNYQAGIEAIQAVDECIGKVVNTLLADDWQILMTADHGNLECMFDTETNMPYTAHTHNQVPLILISNQAKYQQASLTEGSLQDIAPTFLQLMNIQQPPEMTGKNLIKLK